jgi:hypothetical protein
MKKFKAGDLIVLDWVEIEKYHFTFESREEMNTWGVGCYFGPHDQIDENSYVYWSGLRRITNVKDKWITILK